MFITLEGIEGTGKSTQMRRLVQYLRSESFDVLSTYEPGGTPTGDLIRKILLNPDNTIETGTELFLMMSSRRQLVKEVIQPALDEGKVVISDRFVDASFAYQVYGRGLPEEMFNDLAKWAVGDTWPDCTLVLDIDPELGLSRTLGLHKADAVAGQGDRIELSGVRFMEEVREGYLELARRQPHRVKVVPVTDGEEGTFSRLLESLMPALKKCQKMK